MGKIENSNSNTQCCVPQCKSRSTNEIKLFRFPKEESQRKKWTDAIKIEKGITQNMHVCSRHFVKNDYIISDDGGTKVKRLRKMAVPSQNLPWQFPNKRVSPTLAKARMERLKNRSQQKTSDSPVKSESPAKKSDDGKKSEGSKKPKVKQSDGSSEKSEDVEPKSEDISETDDQEVDEKATLNTSLDIKDEIDDDIEENEEADEKNDNETTEAKNDEDNVTRAPTRLRQRKGVLKCEYCGRKCLTPQALQTHQQIAHKNARTVLINLKKGPTTNNKPKSSPKPSLVPLITVKSPESLQQISKVKPLDKSLNTSEVEKVLEEDSDYIATTSESSESSVKEQRVVKKIQRRSEFECPLCKRRFSAFLLANKHIQKHHSGPHNGSKMLLLPKPIRIEICTICNTTLDSNVHICALLKLAMGFVCTGCEQEYKTLTLFDMHKSSRHNDGVESMFFPTLDEFEVWKKRMEAQTLAKYSILDQNDTKKIHRCTHRTGLGAGSNSTQRMCPSSVVVQEFAKGFQVHYYPNHFGHDYEKYSLSDAFKKYSISSLMNRTASRIPDSDEDEQSEDLYVQFKKIINLLVNEAARINVTVLKKLMRKALDMMAIVNSYVEDDDEDVITSSVIKLDPDKDDLQDEVKKALKSLKRPSEIIEVTPAKRRKSVFQSTENTLKTKEAVRFTPTIKEEETENKMEKKNPKLNQSPSFIDTFQDFVGKSLVKPAEKKKRISDSKKTSAVKTKIGQFKPKSPPIKALSPKTPPIKALAPKTPPIKALAPKTPTIKALSPKPPPIKALSPKSPKTKVAPKKSGVKEVEYEVKEQENDCNILILKI